MLTDCWRWLPMRTRLNRKEEELFNAAYKVIYELNWKRYVRGCNKFIPVYSHDAPRPSDGDGRNQNSELCRTNYRSWRRRLHNNCMGSLFLLIFYSLIWTMMNRCNPALFHIRSKYGCLRSWQYIQVGIVMQKTMCAYRSIIKNTVKPWKWRRKCNFRTHFRKYHARALSKEL